MQARWRAIGAIAWVVSVGLAGSLPASATPVCTPQECTILFNGPSGFGIDAADAQFVSNQLGIPILTPGSVGDSSGTLSVIDQDFQAPLDLNPFPPGTAELVNATSMWTVQNVSSEHLLGDLYFLFVANVDEFTDASQSVQYDDDAVGLTLDPLLDPWVLIRAFDPNQGRDFFYPAVALGSLEAEEIADAFRVHFVIKTGMEQTGPSRYVLPQLQVGMGFTPIPEPSTAALLALGLATLAATRKRRP
ncbi:MAG: PEP-CTERM sorting domain-containing protein [Myxococcales bacterium]|nr:PEP-CTERM sorting domain-containing protein [Myxococcales bacterium]